MMTPTEMYKKASEGIYDENHVGFLLDAEVAFGFMKMPDNVKSRIHSLAWERGHSSGYYEVVTCYFDYVDLAKLCLEGKD